MDKVESLVVAIDDLKKKLELPKSIKEAGVDENDFIERLDSLSEEAFDDQCTGANPRYPLIVEIKEIYTNAFYGKDVAVK